MKKSEFIICTIIIVAAFLAAIAILTGASRPPKQLPDDFHRDNKSIGYDWQKGEDMTYKDISILGNDLHRISISEEEYNLMCSVVMAEAKGEPYDAQEAVAQTILNRWLCDDKFPDTITGVIQDVGQFATDTEEPTVSVRLAVRNAIEYYNTFAMNYPKTMYYFRDTEYHRFGLPYSQIGNLYFSLASDATD